ncbi:MAG: hypothetical protein HDR72_00785 [Ruminococcaceae bacterium]|nr:hypothetical protein [Oscillospiraceae bacterium]
MKLKKFFAAVLAGAVALSSLTFTASAEEAEDTEKVLFTGSDAVALWGEKNFTVGSGSGKDISIDDLNTYSDIAVTFTISDVTTGWQMDSIVKAYPKATGEGYEWAEGDANKAVNGDGVTVGKSAIDADTIAADTPYTVNIPLSGVLETLESKLHEGDTVMDAISDIGVQNSYMLDDAVFTIKKVALVKSADDEDSGDEEPGDDENDPTDVEIAFDKTKDYTLDVIDASGWNNPAFTKAAQKNVPATVDGITPGTTTYGDIKNMTFEVTGVDWSGYTLPDGITASDISIAAYAQWQAAPWWSSENKLTMDMSQFDLDDDLVLGEIGYQITVNGNVGGIDDMTTADTIKLAVKSTTEEPGDDETPAFDPDIDTSNWQIAAMGFTSGWGGWQASTAAKGALTYTCTVQDIMTANGITDISELGGISAQVWSAALGDIISYTVVVEAEDGTKKINTSGDHEVVETDNKDDPLDFMLGQYATAACGGTYTFAATDTVTITITGTARAEADDPEDPGETDSTVLWEGSKEMPANWSGSVEIASAKFADAKAGDKIVLTLTPASGAQVAIKYTTTDWPALPGFAAVNDGHDYSDVITAGTYEMTLTAADITALAEFSMVVSGHDYTLTKVELVSEGGSGTTPTDPSTPSNPSTPSTPSRPSTPSTPSEPEKTVEFENSDTKIEVTAPEGAFEKPEEVTFNAAPVAEETKDETFTFDLSFTDKDGNKVQPKSAVTVKIPVPEALKGKNVYVYHIEDNGTYTEISCKVENGMVVFTATSFSKYVITSQKLNANGEPVTEQPGTTNPGTANPSTGVAGAAAVLSIAAVAAGALIVSKKRK